MLPVEVLLLSTCASTATLATAYPADLLSNSDISPRRMPVLEPAQVTLSNSQPQPTPFTYQCFGGMLANYPDQDSWLSWSALWDLNREQILSSNKGNGYTQHYILDSIIQVSDEYDIDARIILALMMQESAGNAATPCQSPGPRCGIMHALKGQSFDESRPKDSIVEMIREAVKGSLRRGPMLKELLEGKPSYSNVPIGNAYAAVRVYRSGGAKSNLDVVGFGAARHVDGYVNDFANRLLGWDGRGKGFDQCGGWWMVELD